MYITFVELTVDTVTYFSSHWLFIINKYKKYSTFSQGPTYFPGINDFSLAVSSKMSGGYLSFLLLSGRNSAVCLSTHVVLPKSIYQD